MSASAAAPTTAAKAVQRARVPHAQRSAQTRQQVLQAAAALVRSGGPQAASMFEVAKAAGVTPGALQHHFGTKAELMMALVEHLLSADDGSGVAWPAPSMPLPRRCRAFVQALWLQVYAPPRFLAAWSVYFGSTGDAALMARIAERRRAVNSGLRGRLLAVFPELAGRRDTAALADLVFASLRGLAMAGLFDAAAAGPVANVMAGATTGTSTNATADPTQAARRELARLIEARCHSGTSHADPDPDPDPD